MSEINISREFPLTPAAERLEAIAIENAIESATYLSPYLVVSYILNNKVFEFPKVTFEHRFVAQWHEKYKPEGEVIVKGIKNPIYELTLFSYVYLSNGRISLASVIREKGVSTLETEVFALEDLNSFAKAIRDILDSQWFAEIVENI